MYNYIIVTFDKKNYIYFLYRYNVNHPHCRFCLQLVHPFVICTIYVRTIV